MSISESYLSYFTIAEAILFIIVVIIYNYHRKQKIEIKNTKARLEEFIQGNMELSVKMAIMQEELGIKSREIGNLEKDNIKLGEANSVLESLIYELNYTLEDMIKKAQSQELLTAENKTNITELYKDFCKVIQHIKDKELQAAYKLVLTEHQKNLTKIDILKNDYINNMN